MKADERKSYRYEDIIKLPHHVSTTHPRMDCLKRAAQFAPFAALAGYDEALEETRRIVEEQIESDNPGRGPENEMVEINNCAADLDCGIDRKKK